MNNNNQNDNIVKPISVDTTNSNIDHTQDTFLNRERENIVSATVQANNAIDKTQAKEVNNEFKIKKNNNFLAGVFILLGIMGAIAISILAISFLKEVENANTTTTSTTTTTTTLSMFQNNLNYLTDYSKVRKYQNDSYVLMLSPESYDLVNNEKFYMLYSPGDRSIIGLIEYGTYKVVDSKLELKSLNIKKIRELTLTDEGLILEGKIIGKKDSEMKSYYYKGNNEASILMINGTIYNEQALYIEASSTKTLIKNYKFTENQTSISLENGTTFTKDGINITLNGKTYNYMK